MKSLKDKVVAITGAGSGIGRGLALRLASEGCALALSDINETGLQETAGMIKAPGAAVSTHVVDTGNRDRVYQYADDAAAHHGGVDMIINNAGVTVSESLEKVSYEDFEWLININMWGVVYGTRAFLPLLKKRAEGHIVNISSINGMVPFPHNGPYNMSKCAVRAFSETLMQELNGTGIHVTCVHPGGIKTNILANARFYHTPGGQLNQTEAAGKFARLAKTTPDKAAAIIIAGIKENKKRIMVGMDARMMDLTSRISPIGMVMRTGVITRKVMK
ncbi:MAG: SDR family oxidoreductase [Thermodesulfobacteriota bacterium]|nr:SDR family oxidoreductase [Thermodesulfobacteriota bacterium]